MAFSDIPIRRNGQTVDASWWNTIRTKLVEAFDSLNGEQNEFTVLNNQSTPANITNMVCDKTEKTTYVIFYDIYRKTDSSERREFGYLFASYKPNANTWSLNRRTEIGEDTLNLSDSITINSSTGQIQYVSDSMSGSNYSGVLKWKVVSSFNLTTGGL